MPLNLFYTMVQKSQKWPKTQIKGGPALNGAKVFTKLDARNGFWHIKMDKESSRLTTFHTPFGRYCLRRLPFGICSAPEVFQRRMHEVVEGLVGVEVVADDFLVVGYGDTIEQTTKNHDENLVAFLRRCDKENLVLNADKLHLREKRAYHLLDMLQLTKDLRRIRQK